jgi:cell division protein FtsZ
MPGLINLDFADVKTIMSDMGMAFMGMGIHSGDNRAAEAARKAISNPLLDDISIKGAQGMLINVTGSSSLSFEDLEKATEFIREEAHEDANIIFGAAIDESMGDNFRITVIATGFSTASAQVPAGAAAAEKQVADRNAVQDKGCAVRSDAAAELPDIEIGKFSEDAKVVKIGTIISEFGEDGKYDIPTFVRQQQVI